MSFLKKYKIDVKIPAYDEFPPQSQATLFKLIDYRSVV